MKEIKLTQGKVALVDDDDFEELNKYKWCAMKSHGHKGNTMFTFYAVRHKQVSGDIIFMHRELLVLTDKYHHVDHINGNGIDNRKSNLRIATNNENQYNTSKKMNNSSGFKGVIAYRRKWRAYIRVHSVIVHCGCYNTKIEAAIARDIVALAYHGEYARTNLPLERR